MYSLVLFVGFAGTALAQPQNTQRTTPVPILKQINTQNDDGSYTYGYEGADGSFKIETKYATGEIQGKYGYIGDDGKVREVEYGASRRGFEPAGSDINVPPPVISGNNELDYDDGQYNEDPSDYNAYKGRQTGRKNNAAPRNVFKYQQPEEQEAPRAPQQPQAPAPRNVFKYQQPEEQEAPRAPQQPQTQNFIRYSSPAQSNNQYYAPPPPAPVNYNPPTPSPFRYQAAPHNQGHHAAANVNLHTGSYSLSYVG